jgi:sulfatase modifying factor 1
MKNRLIVLGCAVVLSVLGMQGFAVCPSMDFTGDCRVDLSDFAVFAEQWLTEGSYTLRVNSSGTLGVSISSSTGHDGTTDYTQTLTVGTGVTLTAPATAGSEIFTVWTGDINSTDQTISFLMNADKTVTANYMPAHLPEDLVIIPAGTFQMGNSTNASEGWEDELPVHTGEYEMTNEQYCAFLNSAQSQGLITVISGKVYQSGSGTSYLYCDTSTSSSYSQIVYSNNTFSVRIKGGRDMTNDPMVMVSWYGAVAYCNWRSQQEGKQICYDLSTWNCDFSKKGYRLATEAEWEYAARGRLSGNRFPWGDTITHSQANYYSWWNGGVPYFPYDLNPVEGYHPTWNDGVLPYTSQVGSFPANGYGLYDMAGNVWEWCNDRYSEIYYSSSPTNNPTGPVTGSNRVARGGNYGGANYCRVSCRNNYNPIYRGNGYGFRVVLDF